MERAESFERAIDDAQTLFLFDRRSQQRLQEMADEARPRSRDRYLIRLTQAAFAYYNSADAQATDISRIIKQAHAILKEVKRFREDRVFFTFALRLEVDLLMHQSSLIYQEADRSEKSRVIFNEEDARALSIADTLLKNFPEQFDPLPNSWYSGVVPLFPPYREELVAFYKDRLQEHRIIQLTAMLTRMRDELVIAAGIIKAKQFIAEKGVVVTAVDRVHRYLLGNVHSVGRYVDTAMPQGIHLASDITLPRGILPSQLETATRNVEAQIEQAHKEKDIRRYTGHLLQLGILHFLRENPEETVSALVRTLKASSKLAPEDKKLRQYQHEKFPDIPFMLGTSYIRALLPQAHLPEARGELMPNCLSALMQAISLQRGYHQAYINLLVALQSQGGENGAEREKLFRLYLSNFGNDLAQLSALSFKNLAVMEYQSQGNKVTPDIVKWLIVSEFSTGGEFTKAKAMLQELKTLYILNAHDFSVAYLESYRTAFRLKDEEFIADLENNELHSALLFYIAHAFTSLSLVPGRNNAEIAIEYANLEQAIELNGEALYFNPKNGSALRLVDTQAQIIQFALTRTQKRWENISQSMGQRFQFYEEYLRQEKCANRLHDQLSQLNLAERLPPLKLPRPIRVRMDEVISTEQRERLKHRVEAT